jgi:hypothetical protein
MTDTIDTLVSQRAFATSRTGARFLGSPPQLRRRRNFERLGK